MVASLDLTDYLQATSPPSWMIAPGLHGRYSCMHDSNRCALVHSRSARDLLATYRAAAPPPPPPPTHTPPTLDHVHRRHDNCLPSRDPTASGFSSDLSSSTEETNSPTSSSSSSSWFRQLSSK